MSNIQFRAWDGTEMFYDIGLLSDGRLVETDGESSWSWAEQDGVVVMQSLGIADAQGHMIYDGDIVGFPTGSREKRLFEVYWNKLWLQWRFRRNNGTTDVSDEVDYCLQSLGTRFVVVDNIFENKHGNLPFISYRQEQNV
jgi:hypothetical protein